MKRVILAIAAGMLLFAQGTGPVTITVPADVITAFQRAYQAQRKEIVLRADKLGRKVTEESDPSDARAALAAEIATLIADKVLEYAPSDAPAKRSNESDLERRNRYQSSIRTRVTVR